MLRNRLDLDSGILWIQIEIFGWLRIRAHGIRILNTGGEQLCGAKINSLFFDFDWFFVVQVEPLEEHLVSGVLVARLSCPIMACALLQATYTVVSLNCLYAALNL